MHRVIVFSRSLDRYSYNLLSQLSLSRDYRVLVCVEEKNEWTRLGSERLEFHELGKSAHRLDASMIFRMRGLIRDFNPQACLCYTSRSLFLALMVRFLFKIQIPIIGTRGAIGGMSAFNPLDWITYLADRYGTIVAFSKAIERELSRQRGRLLNLNSTHFQTIYQGYSVLNTDFLFQPIERTQEDKPIFKVLCIANDRPIKGLQLLLESVSVPVLLGLGIEFHIVGRVGDEMQRKTQGLVSDAPQVFFHGFQSDVRPFLREADLYVQPTLHPGEGIGNAIAEAMSAGLPVLTSDVGGAQELVLDGVTGLLFKTGDCVSLAQGIRQLRLDPVLRAQMAATARQRLDQHFSLEGEVEQYHRLLQHWIER
ncbi:MAG: glycosyltransferase family 4 protein [Alphaproteobacteria bacterium]|nr:glycosyltransferase family 4 protein [Alphaproteobacteria bacterium]